MNSSRATALGFAGLYLAIALGLFLLMRDHGFHPTDDGFILAYSWRIVNGEVPYRDFIFERTPLTPYLHAGWLLLPEGWSIQAGRLAFYLEMAASALVMTLWAVSRGLRANVATLAVAGSAFVIALHNFPPMPWPTVDGVSLTAAGVAAFLSWRDGRSARWLALSVTALVLAVLAKQSFAPLLAAVVGYAALTGLRARDARIVATALVPTAVLGGAFIVALAAAGALDPFLSQVAQPAQMRPTATNPWSGDLVLIGVRPYLVALTAGFAPLLALAGVTYLGRDRVRVAPFTLPIALALLIVAAALMPADPYDSGFVLFYGVAMLALADVIRAASGRGTAAPLAAYALVLLAGWCASFSFAYQSPILAVGILGPILALTVPARLTGASKALAAAAFAFAAIVSLAINIELPYRDAPRDQQTADLFEIYPGFGHLYTNPANAGRHRELRELSTRFAQDQGRSFVVFTAFPLAHFLTGTRNPLSVDWLEEQEYVGNDDRLRSELESDRPVMIIQRQQGETVGSGGERLSCADAAASAPAFAAGVLARASLAFEGIYFCVYVP